MQRRRHFFVEEPQKLRLVIVVPLRSVVWRRQVFHRRCGSFPRLHLLQANHTFLFGCLSLNAGR